jgi:DNA mismatch repair protein MutS2
LNREQRFLVVSGPNAGGKSVFLKTVGLLQILFQCGWPLPCDASSASCLMKGMVLGMGDRQDLHQDLSTYAAHLKLMAQALMLAGPEHLILLDEFGAGTDPAIGGSLAEAVLEPWLREGPMVVLNTHYGNLKRLASQWPTVQNARMGFDTVTLKPTYRLIDGAPGSSYAMELARRAGLPEEVLARATALTDSTELRTENLLVEWMDQKQKAEELLKLSQYKEELLDKLLRKQEDAEQQAAARREEQWQAVRLKGRRLLEDQRREMGFVLQQFKDDLDDLRKDLRSATPAHAPGAAWNKALQALQQGANRLQSLEGELQESPASHHLPEDTGLGEANPDHPRQPYAVGQSVKFRDGQLRGVVLSSDSKETEWMVESVRMRTETSRLVPAAALENRVSALPKGSGHHLGRSRGTTAGEPPPRNGPYAGPLPNQVVDLRGLRMHEWEGPLQQRLDRAVVAGEDRIYVLHGKGSGALRQGVRDYLRRQRYVRGFQDAPAEGGGSGWTWVDLG